MDIQTAITDRTTAIFNRKKETKMNLWTISFDALFDGFYFHAGKIKTSRLKEPIQTTGCQRMELIKPQQQEET